MTIKKTLTETYTLRGEQSLWAKINLDCGENSVNVMISSDYGEFNYYWVSTGYTQKKFLCSINMDYAMKKLMGGTDKMYEPGWDSRKRSVKIAIIEARREKEYLSKFEAREAWDDMLNVMEDYSGSVDIYFEEIMEHNSFQKIFYDFEGIPEDDKLKPRVLHFWNNIWLPFTNELRKEYAYHTCGNCKEEYTAKPNSTCIKCGFIGVKYTHDKAIEKDLRIEQ